LLKIKSEKVKKYFGGIYLAEFNNCLIVAKCESKTNGTTQQGSQTYGKYKTAILGWSKANF